MSRIVKCRPGSIKAANHIFFSPSPTSENLADLERKLRQIKSKLTPASFVLSPGWVSNQSLLQPSGKPHGSAPQYIKQKLPTNYFLGCMAPIAEILYRHLLPFFSYTVITRYRECHGTEEKSSLYLMSFHYNEG